MAYMQIEYSSQILGQYRQVDVLYPDLDKISSDSDDGRDIPVLYLLHGMAGNHNSWLHRTNLQRLVRNTNLIVVMPNTENGWYTNTSYGVRYYDALCHELPTIMKHFFPNMTDKREKTFVAGLSMGGYGAFKMALTSNRFAYAGAFSGALSLDFETFAQSVDENPAYWSGVFGELTAENSQNHALVNMVPQHDGKTKFYSWCGKEDFLFVGNQQAVTELKAAGLDLADAVDHGTHDWYYWEKQVEVFLEMLPINYVKEERLS